MNDLDVPIGSHVEVVGGEHNGLLGQVIGYGTATDPHGRPMRALLRHREGRKWTVTGVDFDKLQVKEKA